MQIAAVLLKTSSLRPPVLQLISFTNTTFPLNFNSKFGLQVGAINTSSKFGHQEILDMKLVIVRVKEAKCGCFEKPWMGESRSVKD